MNSHFSTRADARRGLLLIVIAATLWGTIGVSTKAVYGLADTNPLSIGFFRLAIATPALLLACWAALGRRMWRLERRDWGLILMIGAAMALYQVCYFTAIAHVGVAIAVLVALCTAPVMVALLSSAFLGERLRLPVFLALGCALSGTVLLVGVDPSDAIPAQTMISGVVLVLGAGLCYATVTLCGRALAGRCHPLQPISIGFGIGAALLLTFALASGLVVSYPPLGWVLLLHLGLLPTALAYLLFLKGLRQTTATVASIVTLLEPLISTLLAWVIFGERLGPLGLMGAVLLLGAIGMLYVGGIRQVRARTA
ncbi:MAG: DMT family transporter [Chloroflexales bacterium]|nr:DMT family transporter [Chloroflexales bacterium]